MGNSCGCGDAPGQKERIRELEILLGQEQDQYRDVKANYEKIAQETANLIEKSKSGYSEHENKIAQLLDEKKTIFKRLIREKKNVEKLEEEVDKQKQRKSNMDIQIKKLGNSIKKAEERAKAAQVQNDSLSKDDESDYGEILNDTPYVMTSQSKEDIHDIHSWINISTGDRKKDNKTFNKKMADLLCHRVESARRTLVKDYNIEYGRDLIKEIGRKLDAKNPYFIIQSLLRSIATFDAKRLHECILNNDVDNCADLICSRSVSECSEISMKYKTMYNYALKGHLEKVAKYHNKHTVQLIFKCIMSLGERTKCEMKKENEFDLLEIKKHVKWLQSLKQQIKFKDKSEIVELLFIESDAYIALLAREYESDPETKDTLGACLESKFSRKSKSGEICRNRIHIALDKSDFFAQKLRDYAETKETFKSKNAEITNVLISRFQNDLGEIQTTFNNKGYGGGDNLRRMFKNRGQQSANSYFLLKILEHARNET